MIVDILFGIFRSANIPCVVITGVNKNAGYEVGCSAIDRSTMEAQWNAVYLRDSAEWRLVDVQWAATCVVNQRSSEWAVVDVDGEVIRCEEEAYDGEIRQQINEAFFLTDPEQLIQTHLPDDPEWQLLSKKITEQEFMQKVYTRERFYQMKLETLKDSKTECVLHTVNGKVDIKFGIPEESSQNMLFRYLLFKHHNENEHIREPLERFVFYQKTPDTVEYNARFSVAGVYRFDLFGQNEMEDETYDLCVSYLIHCDDPIPNLKPYPDCPEIGWGPGAEAEAIGMTAITHKGPIINTSDGLISIRFNLAQPISVMQCLKNNDIDEVLLKHNVMVKVDNDELLIELRLRDEGEYALNIYADKLDTIGELPNVCNYLIRCEKSNELEIFPRLHEGVIGQGYLAQRLSVKATSHKSDIIRTTTSKLTIDFKAPKDLTLLGELQQNGIDGNTLAEIVIVNKIKKNVSFEFRLPKAGEYAFNVYAKREAETERIHHVYTYFIQSTQTETAADDHPAKELRILRIPAPEGSATIRSPAPKKAPGLYELQWKNAHQNIDEDKVTRTREGERDVYKVTMKEYGEYKFDVFEERGFGGLVHVGQYLIVRQLPWEEAVDTVSKFLFGT